MANSWRTKPSRQRQLIQTQRQQSPGLMDGRVREAAPIPAKIDIEPSAGGGVGLWVDIAANPPADTTAYPFWFVTDEPV